MQKGLKGIPKVVALGLNVLAGVHGAPIMRNRSSACFRVWGLGVCDPGSSGRLGFVGFWVHRNAYKTAMSSHTT